MAQPINHSYHYGSEAEQYTFYRLPKVLFSDMRYKYLSDSAKILYGLMLDRMALSLRNNWLDDKNRVYIYFTLEDVQDYMNCSKDKGVKILAELDTVKGIGLIERVKQGQGKPTIIYVKKFIDAHEFQTSEKAKSRLPISPNPRVRNNRSQDFDKPDCNKTEYIKTERNDTESIQSYQGSKHPCEPDGLDRMETIHSYRELIKQNIEYDILKQRSEPERVEEIVELMVDTVCSSRKIITVAGDDYPHEIVKSRFLKIDSSHVEYVFNCIDQNTTKVRSIKKYLLAALYNAPVTIDSYYRAEVNHHLYGTDN